MVMQKKPEPVWDLKFTLGGQKMVVPLDRREMFLPNKFSTFDRRPDEYWVGCTLKNVELVGTGKHVEHSSHDYGDLRVESVEEMPSGGRRVRLEPA